MCLPLSFGLPTHICLASVEGIIWIAQQKPSEILGKVFCWPHSPSGDEDRPFARLNGVLMTDSMSCVMNR